MNMMQCIVPCCILFISCSDRTPAPTPQSTDSVTSVAPSLLDGVTALDLSGDIKTNCDFAQAAITRALGTATRRRDGTFKNSWGTQRTGCRMIAEYPDSAKPDPLDEVSRELGTIGWSADLRYSADGPDSHVIGMRAEGLVTCVLSYENGGDFVADCAPDPIDPRSVGIPDWATPALSRTPFTDSYSVATDLQMPPFLDIDFNGDGTDDVAVPVANLGSPWRGFAIVFRDSTGAPLIADHDDLRWVTSMRVYRANAVNATIDGVPQLGDMEGDALYLTDETKGLPMRRGILYWNGTRATFLELPSDPD